MQLQIATNTNLISFMEGRHTMLSLIPIYAEHGYKALDLNFCEMMNPDSAIDSGYIERLASLREAYKLSYIQAHAPYPRDYLKLSEEDKRKSDRQIITACSYAAELGIPHIAIHPIKGSIRENIGYFSRIADQISITIAIENMEGTDEISRADQLLEIASALGGKAGILLDTGHAHMAGLSIPDFIRDTASFLIGTHIADNDGKSDQHLLPFFGTIDWKETMKAFRQHYSGCITYECMRFAQHVPFSLAPDIIGLSLRIGRILLEEDAP